MPTRSISRRGALTIALFSVACGGGGGNPASPTPTPGAGGGVTQTVTVSIVADRGAQSFSPNPVTVGQDLMVAWRNTDGVIHRIVANDNSFDTGDIAPGATSRTLQSPAVGANYHCSIHPTMIGAIGVPQGGPPPCTGPYC